MIDHTGVVVSDYVRGKRFYENALASLGYKLLMELPASVTGSTDVAGFGEPEKPDFWITRGAPNKPPIHVAFRVANRRPVDAFYQAALAAGGTDNGKPGHDRITTPITMARSCWTRMDTTSKPCVTNRDEMP